MSAKKRPIAAIAPGKFVDLAVDETPQEVKDLGPLRVLANIWDDLCLTELLDSQIPVDDQVALRPGLALKALVLNIVGGRDPLYRVQDWASQVPLDLILGAGAIPAHLNDTALARHLDRLFDVGGESVFNSACLRVIEREGIDVARVHADTTSRLVFGEYVREDDGAISITRGHSKDKRPDLKQVMYGAATSADGVLLAGQILSGNTSDKKWHGGMLDVIHKQLVVGKGSTVHYVGDSALVTSENFELAEKHGIVLTARVPRNMVASQTAVVRALYEPLPMEDLGTFSERQEATRYDGCVLPSCTLFGRPVQLGVYRPTPSNELARQKVLRRQSRALEDASKAASRLMAKEYVCDGDARSALDDFQREHDGPLLRITGSVVEERIPAKRSVGRPRKDAASSTEVRYRIEITVEADADGAERAIAEESLFVLVHTGKDPISARELLASYKGQIVIEKRFPFLKDPAWAEVFFIKTPHRLEALGYVLLLALLLWSVWERRVRGNLKASGEPPVVDTTGMPKANPTAKVCRHIMASIKVLRRFVDGAWTPWMLAGPLGPEQQRVVRFSSTPPPQSQAKNSATA